jgi:predicted DNA-binding transcriptional regulator AlpA
MSRTSLTAQMINGAEDHTADPARRVRRAVDDKLTLAELCEELQVARSTFYDWRAKGHAPRCIRLPNGDLRIRRSDLERWLAEHEESGIA